ncbi:PilZ domain-containing protein [Aneurinibacillus soli]|uniref:PilZ domain protein n=1 Tax=Aneurinibacillus soli TaxID=1500254 RepID=A0A0U4NLY3_9BACL|nr:PilZ domain-containing protein [Aneurinibacillus soli]PYE61852.1 PilZ domain-containing protein [Aneurinibacillus soli]BAU29668.1 PilZ domain protein [Aneurinibacillus soli]
MQYKRQEGFRLAFPDGLAGTFRILRLEEKNVNSREGDALIHDISPKGAKFSTALDLPLYRGELEVSLHFTLYHEPFDIRGILKWQQEKMGRQVYGMTFLADSYRESELLSELKEYHKEHRQGDK